MEIIEQPAVFHEKKCVKKENAFSSPLELVEVEYFENSRSLPDIKETPKDMVFLPQPPNTKSGNVVEIKKGLEDITPISELLVEDCNIPVQAETSVSDYIDKSSSQQKQYKDFQKCTENEDRNKKKYHCPLKRKDLTSPDSRTKHINFHLPEQCEFCPFCEKCFTNKSNHLNSCFVNLLKTIENPFSAPRHEMKPKCNICPLEFSNEEELRLHIFVHENEQTVTDLKCENCLQQFSAKSTYDKHIRQCQSYKCKVCLVKFNLRENINNHILTNTLEKPYECQKCCKQFTLKCHQIIKCVLDDSQQTVIDINRDPKQPLFQCGICLKQYFFKSQYQRHMFSHTGEKQFECEVCLKQFAHNYSLLNHLRCHGNNKPFECEICLKSFKTKSSLKRHLRCHVDETRFEWEIYTNPVDATIYN